MKVFLTQTEEGLLVQARAEGGGAVGDIFREVLPGDSFLGHSFEQLVRLGEGGHDLRPPADRTVLSRPTRGQKDFPQHAVGEGRWITIGGGPGPKGERHHGGTRVHLDGAGRIDKGPGTLAGKKPDELRDKYRKPEGEAAPDAPPEEGRPRQHAAPTPPTAPPSPFKEPDHEPGPGPAGGGPTGGEAPGGGGEVAETPGGPAGEENGGGREDGNQPAGERAPERVPADAAEVVRRVERFEGLFRSRGNQQAADWLGLLRGHVEAVGTEEALKSLGEEVAGEGEDEVAYAGAYWQDMGDFAEHYLDRNGITLLKGDVATVGDEKIVSTVSASSDEQGVHERGREGDVFPALQTLKNKLEETRHLPGLENTHDLGELMGKPAGSDVGAFTPAVVQKLDETYGAGKWIVKTYSDDAYAGHGIFFPQRAKQIRQDAQNAVWAAGEHLGQYGFRLGRGPKGEVQGVVHESGDVYHFGTPEYEETINGDARKWAEQARAAAPSEGGAALARGREGDPIPYMASPAFPVVGISDAERAAGVTFKTGQEGRVHVVTKNGKAELVRHSTWLKNEHLPVVFESDDTRAMAQAAVDAINALPESERAGQLYAPDVVKTADGYRVVEANPANEAGASGYLMDNPFIIDAYVSQVTGREPGHVKFIRKLLSKKKKPAAAEKWLRGWQTKAQPAAPAVPASPFREADHRRAPDGKFGSGGNGSAPKKPAGRPAKTAPERARQQTTQEAKEAATAALQKVGAMSWSALKRAGVEASRVEHAAKEWAAWGLDAAFGALPSPLGRAARGLYVATRLGTAAAFTTYQMGQAAAEAVAKGRGATEDEAQKLRQMISLIDVLAYKPVTISLVGLGLGPLGVGLASLVPVGTSAYLLYSTARVAPAVARAAAKAVARAAGTFVGFSSRPTYDNKKGVWSYRVKTNPTPPSAGESYFATCERDAGGHCLPKGGGGGGGGAAEGEQGMSKPRQKKPAPAAKPARLSAAERYGNKLLPAAARPPLTPIQRQAIKAYTGNYSKIVNRCLREGGKDCEQFSGLIDCLRSAFVGLAAFPDPVTVYRKITVRPHVVSPDAAGEILGPLRNAHAAGTTVRLKGFQSTSTNPKKMPSNLWNVHLKIIAKKGLDARPYASLKSEAELLLDHDSEFMVHEVREEGEFYYITLEQII